MNQIQQSFLSNLQIQDQYLNSSKITNNAMERTGTISFQDMLARKAPKLYMTGVFEAKVRSITTAKEQTLYLDTADADLMKGKRILIVDDVISTGESLYAIEQLVEKAGGIICGRLAILAEGDAQTRDDIKYIEKLPLFDKNGNALE